MQKYQRGEHIKEAVTHTEEIFGTRLSEARRVLDLMRPRSIHDCEVVATLYAAWNDLIRAKKPHTDEDIIKDVYLWHPKKKDTPEKEWRTGLKWLRDNGLVPTGKAKPVKKKPTNKR